MEIEKFEKQTITIEKIITKLLDKQIEEDGNNFEDEHVGNQMVLKKLVEIIQYIAEKNRVLNNHLHRKEMIIQQQKRVIEQLGREYTKGYNERRM
jgi:hypothetical protein